MSLNMSCSKFLEPKQYPDCQTYSQNKSHNLSSQVVIVASFVLLMSTLHTHMHVYNKSCPICSGKAVTYSTSEKHSGNKRTETLLLSTGTHSREDIFIKPLSKMVGDGAVWLPYLNSATSTLEVTFFFFSREEIHAHQCN